MKFEKFVKKQKPENPDYKLVFAHLKTSLVFFFFFFCKPFTLQTIYINQVDEENHEQKGATKIGEQNPMSYNVN